MSKEKKRKATRLSVMADNDKDSEIVGNSGKLHQCQSFTPK